jgi:hypothetical protein
MPEAHRTIVIGRSPDAYSPSSPIRTTTRDGARSSRRLPRMDPCESDQLSTKW